MQVSTPRLREGESHITKWFTPKLKKKKGKNQQRSFAQSCLLNYFIFPYSVPTFYPSTLIINPISNSSFILPSKFIPVIQRMTSQEKDKAADLGHGACCQVLGLICFHRLAKQVLNIEFPFLNPTGIRPFQQTNAKIF